MDEAHQADFDLPNDIWYAILNCIFPDTLSNVRICSKYFYNLTDPRLPPMNRYWKSLTKLLIQKDDNLNIIEIPRDYSLNNWFEFYFEWKRLGVYIQSLIRHRESETYNHLIEDQILEFLVTLGVPGHPESRTKYGKYDKIYRGCVNCDCSILCDLLIKIRDIFKEFESTTNYNYDYNVCLIAGEPLYDRLLTWFLFESIEFEAVGIINYLLSLDDFKIDCIDPRYDQTPLIYAINCARSININDKDSRLDKYISIITKLITHCKMTPDILNEYTDDNNRTALALAMNSSCFKEHSNIAALLLKHGADINLQTGGNYKRTRSDRDHSTNKNNSNNKRKIIYKREYDGCTAALTQACGLEENLGMFQLTVDIRKESLFDRDPSTGMTTLMHAVDSGHYNIVKFIVNQLNEMKDELERKKRKRMFTNKDYETVDKIENFINAGKNSNGYTAYFIACEKGDWKIVKYLIKSLDINVAKCYLKEFSCIGYRFTGSEAAKAAGHHKLARWLYRREKPQNYYENRYYNDRYY